MTWLAILLSMFAMTAIVALRYLAASGVFAMLTHRVRPGYHSRLGPQIRREIEVVARFGGDLRHPCRARRMGMAGARLDADLHRLGFLAAVVSPAGTAALSLCARHLVLLDAQAHAPAALVPEHACGAPCQPPTNRLGGDELPPLGSADRCGGHSSAGIHHPDPCRDARPRALGDDRNGGHQPHGLGDVSPRAGSFEVRQLADNRQPPPARHHEEYRCNYGLYFRFWDRLCGTDRGLSPNA